MAFRNRPRGWDRTSKRVIARDGGICWLCELPGADTADHIVPRSKGGHHGDSNLRAAHRVCNSRRGATGATQTPVRTVNLPNARRSRWG